MTPPIRVLFITTSMEIGGSEAVLTRLLGWLDRSRFEPHLALLLVKGPLLTDVPGDIHVHSVGVSRARYAPISIARLCWSLRPRVVVAFGAHVSAALMLARPLMPCDIATLIREGANITLADSATRLRRFIYRHLYRKADIVICQSDHMVHQLTSSFHVPLDRIVRIYNPVDTRALTSKSESHPNPYHGPGPHLLSIGRFVPAKGFDLLLHAMSIIRNSIPSAELTVIGYGPLECRLRNMAQELRLGGRVHFVGKLSNPWPHVKYADLLVLPSRLDALPNVVLEAVALGRAVVATDCPGGIREIAQASARVRLVPEITHHSIAAGVIAALGEQVWISGAGPGAEFEHRFSQARIVAQYENVLERVAGLTIVSSRNSSPEYAR